MTQPNDPIWIIRELLPEMGAAMAGFADLSGIPTPPGPGGETFPRAVSFAFAMDPEIMAGIENGPTEEYSRAYISVNRLINQASAKVVEAIELMGGNALALHASQRTDEVNIRGDFPHKTAATRAGLGWIGRNCQLITKEHGPWVRLGTVFTDMDAPCGAPVKEHGCGSCDMCVEACPAGALTGRHWFAGAPRREILDAARCDEWKKEHFSHLNKGRNCGICSAACPMGR